MQIISRSEAKANGLKFYFTGKPCKHGHISPRYTANQNCRGCKESDQFKQSGAAYRERVKATRSEYNARYYEANKERFAEYSKRWRANNAQSIIDRRKSYREANRDALNQKTREWRDKNPGYAPPGWSEYSEKWYQENKERLSEIRRLHYQSNRGAYRANRLNRIARERSAEGRHTSKDVESLLKAQDHKCANCKACTRRTGYHVDHIQPLSKGGSNWPDNLQILCPTCNLSKSDKDPIEWARKNGRLL